MTQRKTASDTCTRHFATMLEKYTSGGVDVQFHACSPVQLTLTFIPHLLKENKRELVIALQVHTHTYTLTLLIIRE